VTRGGAPEALALALSPLLKPLRFLTRAGPSRMRELGPLVAEVVERARPYAGDLEPRLDRLAESARRFDAATEEGRRVEVAELEGGMFQARCDAGDGAWQES